MANVLSITEDGVDEPVSMKFLAQCDRETVIDIATTIATDGCHADPDGLKFQDSFFFRCLPDLDDKSMTITPHKRAGSNSAIPKEWFTDFVLGIRFDNDGRVFKFYILVDSGCDRQWDLPPAIGCLERLRELAVVNCRSLSHRELSNMLSLKKLHLFRCTELLKRFPVQMRLPHLEQIQYKGFEHPLSASFSTWVNDQMPKLETLACCHDENWEENNFAIYPDLDPNAVVLCNKDKTSDKSLVEEDRILSVLRNFPKVSNLRIDLQEFRSLLRRLIDREQLFPLRLCRLELLLESQEQLAPEDIEGLCRLLRLIPTIEQFDCTGVLDKEWVNDINLELLRNRAGRRFVERRETDRRLPLAAWPHVLERLTVPKTRKFADRVDMDECQACATSGVYYLLRETPAIFGLPAKPSESTCLSGSTSSGGSTLSLGGTGSFNDGVLPVPQPSSTSASISYNSGGGNSSSSSSGGGISFIIAVGVLALLMHVYFHR